MPRINRSFILLFIGFLVRGQSILYQEGFQNQNGKGALGSSTGVASIDLSNVNWSLDVSQCQLSATSDWLQVVNNQLEARDIDGEGIWYSPLLNLQSSLVYGFSLQASELGTLESSDYLITEYSLDAGSWIRASENGLLSDDFINAEVAHFGLVGSTLQLRVRFKNNANSEYLRIDNLKIEAYQELIFQNGQWNREPDLHSAVIDVRIKSGSSVHLSRDARIKKLIIESNATIEIDSSITLSIDTDLQNDGQLIIASDAALVQSQTTNTNTGSGQTKVYRNYYCPDHLRFSFWSSPVQNALIETVFASSNPNDRYEFLANSQSFSAYAAGILVPGKAYASTPTIQASTITNGFNDTKVFEGAVNNGPITVILSGIQGGDWLLVGNPYPCPIDFTAFQAANPDILNAIHYWDASTNSLNGSGYAIWNNAGSIPVAFSNRGAPSQIIPAMQGFMVQVNPAYSQSSLSLQFDNSMRRRLNQNPPNFFKNDMEPSLVWLSLGDSLAKKSTLVVLREGASLDFDEEWDAVLTFNDTSSFSLFTLSRDSVSLAIQCQNLLGNHEHKRVVPLPMVNSELPRTWLAIDSIRGAQELEISVYDKHLDKEILKGIGSVETAGLSASIENRYELHFKRKQYSYLGLEEDQSQDLPSLQLNQGIWNLSLANKEAIRSITLYDISGKLLFREDYDQAQESFSIATHSIPAGILTIKWIGARGSLGRRKFYNPNL